MQPNSTVVTRSPVLVRIGGSAICLLLVAGVMTRPVHASTVIITVVAICWDVCLLAYRAEVDAAEVRIRYAPFYVKRTPMGEVTHLTEKRTLVLVTATKTIPLWGLSPNAREELFKLLPHRLEVVADRRRSRADPAASLRRYLRWTAYVGAGIVATIALLVPFLQGNPLHEYADSIGKYVMFVFKILWILFFWLAGMSWVYWSYLREERLIDRGQPHTDGTAGRNRGRTGKKGST